MGALDYEAIFTVVIKNDYDLSTVSFRLTEDAIEYCISEIESDGEEIDHDELYDKLDEQRFYDGVRNKYYIEDTRLY